jgi:hypothetical protein
MCDSGSGGRGGLRKREDGADQGPVAAAQAGGGQTAEQRRRLDLQSRANLWQHIRTLHAEHGTTLFLTTHYLDEADAPCNRILVIDDGRIVAQGSPDELKRTVAGDTVTLAIDSPARTAQLVQALPGRDGARGPRRHRALPGATGRAMLQPLCTPAWVVISLVQPVL